MSSDRDPRFSPSDEPEDDFEEEEAPRSIFSAAWFRVVLVLLGIGVVGAVAVPYVLEVVNPPMESAATRTAAAPKPAPVASAPSATTSPATSTPAPSSGAGVPAATTAPPASSPSAGTPARPGAEAPAAAAPSSPAPQSPARSAMVKAAPAEAEKPVTEKPAAKKAAAAEKPVAAEKPAARTTAKAAAGGEYFVQVGAFREQATAKRVAAQLRDLNYPVDESVKRSGDAPAAAPRPTARAASGPDRYDVIVSGGSSAEINTRLAAKGLASEPAGDGVRIRPSLPLRDAVALSKDLGGEGFKVQVRRGGAGGATAEAAPPAIASDAGGQTLYRVRVGGFPDRAAAQAALKELQEKGFQPFIARGRE